MSLGWLAAGFGAAWAVLGAYVVRLWTTQRRLASRIGELERAERRP